MLFGFPALIAAIGLRRMLTTNRKTVRVKYECEVEVIGLNCLKETLNTFLKGKVKQWLTRKIFHALR